MEESRNSRFADRTATRIWLEQASPENPYLAEHHYCHGYALEDLAGGCDGSDILYLLLKGELPAPDRKDLLRRLSVLCVSAGPRHPASRAVMNAAASGTHTQHLLPIGLSLLGGQHQGAQEVSAAARFIGRHMGKSPETVASDQLAGHDESTAGDTKDQQLSLAPGFGRHYDGIDPWARRQVDVLRASPGAGQALAWAECFADCLAAAGHGLLPAGVVGAACIDLGLPARTAGPLWQLLAAPGLLAHGLEMTGKTIYDLPFLDDSQYEFVTATGDDR